METLQNGHFHLKPIKAKNKKKLEPGKAPSTSSTTRTWILKTSARRITNHNWSQSIITSSFTCCSKRNNCMSSSTRSNSSSYSSNSSICNNSSSICSNSSSTLVPSWSRRDFPEVCPEHSRNVDPNWPHSSEPTSTSCSYSTDWRQERQVRQARQVRDLLLSTSLTTCKVLCDTGLQVISCSERDSRRWLHTCGPSCWWGQTPAAGTLWHTGRQTRCRSAPEETERTTGSPTSPRPEPAAETPTKQRHQIQRNQNKVLFQGFTQVHPHLDSSLWRWSVNVTVCWLYSPYFLWTVCPDGGARGKVISKWTIGNHPVTTRRWRIKET